VNGAPFDHRLIAVDDIPGRDNLAHETLDMIPSTADALRERARN
jgi:hypothetical protein